MDIRGAFAVLFACYWCIQCGQGSKLGGGAAVVAKQPVPEAPKSGGCQQNCSGTQAPGSTQSLPVKGLDTFEFNFVQYNPKVDYLIVLDNSKSMSSLADKVSKAMVGAAVKNKFPGDSLIAVMTTMIGKDSDYSKVSDKITATYKGIELEPGFLSFVSRPQILKFKNSNAVDRASRNEWKLEGCDSEWFKPTEKDSSGVPCIKAAMQLSVNAGPVEAGVHAFKQLLLKNQGKPLFRSGAFVNVIFVSDTHDPGNNEPDLFGDKDTYNFTKLNQLASSNSPGIQALRFHAIAPEDNTCGERNIPSADRFTYNILAGKSQGTTLGFCKALKALDPSASYDQFVEDMIDVSFSSEPRFVLSEGAAKILKVTVNDVEVTNYSLLSDGYTVEFSELSKVGIQKISIRYLPKG